MARLTIGVLLIVSSLLIAMPNDSYARKQEGPAAEKAWFQNICQGNEKVTKLHFYVQSLLVGENATMYEVAHASITFNSMTFFGQVNIVDDPITAEPDINSKKLGKVQGMTTSADMETLAFTINFNFYFTFGKYNGSSITILGRNQLMNEERELPVVGGTGIFRFARGYAITKTYSIDIEKGNNVFEFTIYVTYVDGSSMNLEANV